MRARYALKLCGISYDLIEVDLKNKPQAMLTLSPKGTVPVLDLGDRVIDESLDIVHWAFSHGTPDGWHELAEDDPKALALLEDLHTSFIPNLNRFKYVDRYPDSDPEEAYAHMQAFLQQLEKTVDVGVMGPLTWVDCVCLPLVRQAYKADEQTWPTPKVLKWLTALTQSEAFESIMKKA